jgi:hypothetical protein
LLYWFVVHCCKRQRPTKPLHLKTIFLVAFCSVFWCKKEIKDYLGKTKVTAARQPKLGLDELGPAIGMRGPAASETVCLPNLVTPDTVGTNIPEKVLDFQFWVSSMLPPMPAPLFQL